MSAFEYERRGAREERVTRVATLVAALVHRGMGWSAAVDTVALELEVSSRSVAACVAETARRLNDRYLESVGA